MKPGDRVWIDDVPEADPHAKSHGTVESVLGAGWVRVVLDDVPEPVVRPEFVLRPVVEQ